MIGRLAWAAAAAAISARYGQRAGWAYVLGLTVGKGYGYARGRADERAGRP